jgi:hypothetical protein
MSEYAGLSDSTRTRIDNAELVVARVRDWVTLMADRGPENHLIARELCLLLGWAAPKPGEKICARCGAIGLIHGIH